MQRFEKLEDLEAARCTIEEREEYEPHLLAGNVVFAGVDYAHILERTTGEADLTAAPAVQDVFSRYPHIGPVLPPSATVAPRSIVRRVIE